MYIHFIKYIGIHSIESVVCQNEWWYVWYNMYMHMHCVLNEFEGIWVYVDRLLEIASICNYS